MLGVPPAETHKFQIFVVVACDYLWFTRNKTHHDGIIPNALIISTTINKTALEHYFAWTTKYDKTPEVWKSHSPPYLKINYDTTIRTTFSTQAAVCRDSTGSIIKCTSLISSHCSALYGDVTAALLTARLKVLLGLSSFLLEGDSFNVTMTLQHPAITTDWRIASTISNIHSTIPPIVSWKASHVNRSANFCNHHVANWIATIIHSRYIPFISPLSTSFPPCIGKDSPSTFFIP
jgi:hypothetical protein